jgi:AraC-like DNA-binding protein
MLNRGAKRTVRYTNLLVGSYRFWVTACSSDGVWNESGASFDFTITSGFSLGRFLLILFFLSLLTAFLFLVVRKKIILPARAKTKKYKTSTLDREEAREIVKKLTHLLEYEKVYRDETISLQSLAQELSISYHRLSQIINEKMQKNFFDLINGYRVEEAKKRLVDPAEGARNVLAIAFDVGFNTKAAFNRVFKKYTGMTPSQYRKEFKK